MNYLYICILGYVKNLFSMVLKNLQEPSERCVNTFKPPQPLYSSYDHPDKGEPISQHISRFGK